MLPPWLSLSRILREGGFLQGKWPHHTFHTAYLVSIMDSTLYRASDQPAWTPRAKLQQNKASSPSSIPTGPGHQLVNLKAVCTNMLFPRNMCFLKQYCRLCLLGSWIYLSVNYSKSWVEIFGLQKLYHWQLPIYLWVRHIPPANLASLTCPKKIKSENNLYYS